MNLPNPRPPPCDREQDLGVGRSVRKNDVRAPDDPPLEPERPEKNRQLRVLHDEELGLPPAVEVRMCEGHRLDRVRPLGTRTPGVVRSKPVIVAKPAPRRRLRVGARVERGVPLVVVGEMPALAVRTDNLKTLAERGQRICPAAIRRV